MALLIHNALIYVPSCYSCDKNVDIKFSAHDALLE